ncbi:hypothetical protein BV911_01620 [Pseudoruegeria sp. SK021]|nr:hypothetical protein BV911_01620 [Pseudoruegeria sp. SK021]
MADVARADSDVGEARVRVCQRVSFVRMHHKGRRHVMRVTRTAVADSQALTGLRHAATASE